MMLSTMAPAGVLKARHDTIPDVLASKPDQTHGFLAKSR
jgi:hypothetical protein